MSEEERHGDAKILRGAGKGRLKASSSFSAASSGSRVPTSSLRVFCALELPAEVRARAAEAIARLRESVPEVRASWERVEKLHLTLKFIGEIAPERVEALKDAAARAALQSQPFILALSGAGAFPARGNPRVLWLGIEDSAGALARLHSHLEEECAIGGFAREERPFHPHLTLARIRAPQGSRKLAERHRQTGFERIEFTVPELVVLQSELRPGGSLYKEISRHEFHAIQPL